MTISARLYAQLAWVAHFDAAAQYHENEWPPVTPTPDELEEAARLTALADALFEEAEALGFKGCGLGISFDEEPKPTWPQLTSESKQTARVSLTHWPSASRP